MMTFFLCGGGGFVLFVVAGVHVGREGFELGCTGVDELVDGLDAELLAQSGDLRGGLLAFEAKGGGEALVGEAFAFGGAEVVLVERRKVFGGETVELVGDLLHVVQEPGVHAGEVVGFADGHAVLEGVAQVVEALRVGSDQALADATGVDVVGAGLFAGLERANGFHERLFEGAPDGHDFADGFHLRAEGFVGPGEFFELPLGDLGDDVVDGGFEAGGAWPW